MNSDANFEEQEELYHLMRACGHVLYHSGFRKTGQARILHILDRQGPVSQKQLQEDLDIQSGSISEILAKLEREGLIRREKDETDHRKAVVYMTEAGKEHARKYHESQKEKDWFAALDSGQRAQLRDLLEVLLASWKEMG